MLTGGYYIIMFHTGKSIVPSPLVSFSETISSNSSSLISGTNTRANIPTEIVKNGILALIDPIKLQR